MDTTSLEDLGLTHAEIKVYLSLLEVGNTKAGTIIEKAGLQSSVVHNCLHTLLDKGLISYVKKGKIKHYQASDPNSFIDFIEEKKKNFEKLLPQLLSKQKSADEKNEAEVYETYQGIMNMLLELIKDTKPGDDYLFFSQDVEQLNKEIQQFFMRYDPKRKAKKLNVKGIAPLHLKKLYEHRVKKGMMKMKYTTIAMPTAIAICNDKLVLLSWEEKPVGYLIHSKQLAEKYTKFFH